MAKVELSVVIASHDAATVIEACLAALEPQRADGVEVILADSSGDGTCDLARRRFPWVHVLHFDQPLAIPTLRGRGLAASTGQVIAFLDPFSIAAGDWARQVLAAHRLHQNLVIGGDVDLHRAESRPWTDWVIYLNEYALFMPPVARGETWILPGSNISYKRDALFDGTRPRYQDFWKTFVNREIAQSGSRLWLEPAIRVSLNKPIPFMDYLRTRFDHGRCFAGMRVKEASPVVRACRAASTPLVPVLLTWRWSRGFWSKRRHRVRFMTTIPLQLVLFGVWACGEACGYVRGAGRTCEQLFY